MGRGIRSFALSILLCACSGEISETDDGVVQQEAELAGDACPVFTATNSAHVSAGRAVKTTRRVSIFTVTTYLAVGTNESLGSSGTSRTTLYQIGAVRYSRSSSNCPTGTGGTGGTGGAGGVSGGGAGMAGVGGGTGGTGGSTSGGCGLAAPSSGSKQITVNGTVRSYELYVPSSYDSRRAYPVVFAFHGLGGNGRLAQSYFRIQQASGSDAIVIYPDGLVRNGASSWGLFGADASTDFAFFDALVANVKATLCVNDARLFVTGHSYGGYFSNTLGCARGNVIRAIAPVAGGGPYVSCDGGKVAVWIEASTDDPTVAYSNGVSSRDFWLSANHCAATTRAVGPSSCVEYDGCDAGHPVRWCSETSQGHNWPSYAGSAIWSFFSAL